MTVIKAAAVQLSPVLYSREGTVDKVYAQKTDTQPKRGTTAKKGDIIRPPQLLDALEP